VLSEPYEGKDYYQVELEVKGFRLNKEHGMLIHHESKELPETNNIQF
jgi:hypothetical protein